MKGMLVHFAYEWYPQRSGDIISAIHLNIKEGQDPEKVAVALVRRLSTRVSLPIILATDPITSYQWWSSSIHELNGIWSWGWRGTDVQGGGAGKYP